MPARLDLDRLLRVLKPFKRRVLEMAYLEDMPEQEIAEVLGSRPRLREEDNTPRQAAGAKNI